MAVGTGMTLSGFALIVLYARNTAMKVGKWYQFSPTVQQRWGKIIETRCGDTTDLFCNEFIIWYDDSCAWGGLRSLDS